jgi:hypothetical protein
LGTNLLIMAYHQPNNLCNLLFPWIFKDSTIVPSPLSFLASWLQWIEFVRPLRLFLCQNFDTRLARTFLYNTRLARTFFSPCQVISRSLFYSIWITSYDSFEWALWNRNSRDWHTTIRWCHLSIATHTSHQHCLAFFHIFSADEVKTKMLL